MAVEIVAEAAQGYEGDPTLARLLARGAGRAGADAVKFQLVYADELATPDYRHHALFRRLEMPRAAWRAVRDEAGRDGLRLYLDVFGERSLEDALALEADGVKIHSSDFWNGPLVRAALKTMPRVFVGLGGVTPAELGEWLACHQVTGGGQVCFLYGFQAEPTPLPANNLRRLRVLRQRFGDHRFGFMDHADGGSDAAMTLAVLALGIGVDCLEKHITLDRALELEDYVSGLAPDRFRAFVRAIRDLEQALGSDDLELTEAERDYRARTRKVVVAARDLRHGETLTGDDVRLKRVGTPPVGSPLERIEEAVGRRVLTDVPRNGPLAREALA